MAVEIVWLGVARGARPDPRRRCRYCARVLTPAPACAAEFVPHCASGRCPVCAECAAGYTAVSPVRPAP